MENKQSWLKRHLASTICFSLLGISLIIYLGGVIDGNFNNQTSTQTTGNETAQSTSTSLDLSPTQISEDTGISLDDINGAFSIVARYGLDNTASATVVKQAAEIYQLMENGSQYSAVLKQEGVGSTDDIADTIAHLIKSWNVQDADVSTSTDAVFNAAIKSTYSWDQLTGALIDNGPYMSGYTSLSNAALNLYGLQTQIEPASAIDMFNTVGQNLADPNSKLNMAMGGSGYIRTLVKQGGNDGIINAIQKISAFLKSDQQSVNSSTSPTPIIQSVPTTNNQSPISLSQAIENYSENDAYNFSDGSDSNVDVIGTIKTLMPAQTGVTAAFGNSVIIIGGTYSAAVHQIDDTDFQALSVGEKVEVKGGYMQDPENNVVQVIKVESVKEFQ
jgi:hypothetical protein